MKRDSGLPGEWCVVDRMAHRVDWGCPMNKIVPCIWLDNQAEEVAEFYAKTFPRGRITATTHFPADADNPAKKPRGSVLTVDVELAGQSFSLLNGGPIFQLNPTISFFVNLPTANDVENVYGALLKTGEALMPLGTYPWSQRYGWVKDRYGVSWQVMMHADLKDASIAPCLMFSDSQHGQANNAINFYTSVFPGSRIEVVERYKEGEGPVGTVKHGRFSLFGQTIVAMDSHIKHNVSFNEALSLQVMCDDQKEIDRYWESLSDGGAKSVCGWVTDRFGVAWQVPPRSTLQWIASSDSKANDRALNAIWRMKKIDIAAIERAHSGA